MDRREGEGDVRVRGGVTGAVVVDRRCYGDLAVGSHQVEGVGRVECAGNVGVRGEVLRSICGEISKLA